MPQRKPVRVGIAGMGPRGRRAWLKNCQRVKGCQVTALCDRSESLLQQAYREAGDPDVACYTDFDRMLKEGNIDAVAVVAAPHDQPDLICRALEAGKHATCEVSLTYDMGDLWRVVVAVERSGLKFQMGEQILHAAFVKAWKQMVSEGKLGKVIFAEGHYLHWESYWWWVDSETNERLTIEQARSNPNAVKSRMWNWLPHPILYLATDLGPILTILEDRVTRVTCMATRPESYHDEGVPASDIEVALMHTEKDTIIRMASGFSYATSSPHHWWHLEGTKGKVETARSVEIYSGRGSGVDTPKIWLADAGMDGLQSVDWQYSPDELPTEAVGSGHGNLDYFAISSFVNAILNDSEPALDVYKSADLTAPAIVAARSVEQGSACLEVPDFRPSERRRRGQFPDEDGG